MSIDHMIPSATGTLVAGLIVDNLNPSWLWILAACGAILAALLYLSLQHFRPQQSEATLAAAIGD